MALTPSNIFEQGKQAPDFSLQDAVTGSSISLNDVKGSIATVVMFICNHCPYVLHINQALVALANDYNESGVGFVAISSNDIEKYPQDAPDKMSVHAIDSGYSFPYLYDSTQEIAKVYNAACTPDIYVFDKDLLCTYHGQLDDSRPGNGLPVTGQSVRTVLDVMIEGGLYYGIQKPSVGCNIKWK